MGRPPALVIEFFGFPGAGKSTLTEHLLHRLRAEGGSYGHREAIGRLKEGRAEHYARLAAFTLAEWRHVRAAMRLAAAVTPARVLRWWFAAKLATWPYRLSLVYPRHYDTVVLDQGPLQSAWCVLLDGELHDDGALRHAVHDVLEDNDVTFALVHVDIPPEVAADRIVTRGPMAAPFNRGRAETLRLLAAHQRQFAQILAIAEQEMGIPVLHLDGLAPLEVNDAEIVAFVDRLSKVPTHT